MNKHIIIGDGRKCMCGIFEGKPLHCSDIIKSIETIKRHGQSWDGGLLARLLDSYIVDFSPATLRKAVRRFRRDKAAGKLKPVGDDFRL